MYISALASAEAQSTPASKLRELAKILLALTDSIVLTEATGSNLLNLSTMTVDKCYLIICR
jgi:hypothetical protein